MLERDYFLRILQEFANALATYLEKRDDTRQDEMLHDIYAQYVGPYELLRNCTWQEAVAYAQENWPNERRIKKLDMLADLWFTEGQQKSAPLRDMLLEKAFSLYDYVEAHSDDFSLLRQQHLQQIKEELSSRDSQHG